MSKDNWHYSEQGSICRPIKSLEELLFWDEDQILSEESTTDIIPVTPASDGLVRKVKRGVKNKLIICHDMKGGYNEDIYPNGEDGLIIPDFIWKDTSMFIYFSHNFITVPTLATSWIEKSHQNGALCLGTFITEWAEGKQRCCAVLRNYELIVEQMLKIQRVYGFDGWLINIEHELPEKLLPDLVEFLRLLKERSLVIWYDAVTSEGKLEWQDHLNDKNEIFFEYSDGLFTNYTWTDEKIKSGQEFCDRKNIPKEKIYHGVDVFGRNTYGGGEQNTNASVAKANEHGFNSAIFAPGWLVEKDINEEDQESFWKNINRAITQ